MAGTEFHREDHKTRSWDLLYPLAYFLVSVYLEKKADLVASIVNNMAARNLVTSTAVEATFTISSYIFAGLLIVKLGDFLLWDLLLYRRSRSRTPKLIKQLLNSLIMLLALVASLNVVWDLKIADVITTSGFIGLILGFAMRPILADFFSGIILNFDNCLSIEEWVIIRQKGIATSTIGCVKEITWRTTRILTPENRLHVIPNSEIITATIINLSRPSSLSEFETELCLDFSVNLELAQNIIDAALCEAVISAGGPAADPAPKARIKSIDAEGVHFKITYVVDPASSSKGKVRHVIFRSISKHLRFGGVSPASSKREVSIGRIPDGRSSDYNSMSHKLEIVSRVDLFTCLKEEELQELAGQIEIRHYRANETIIAAGSPGESMFIVVVGFLNVIIQGTDELINVGNLKPGEFFGEMSLLTGEDRSATVQAAVNSILYEIDRYSIGKLLEGRAELMRVLSEVAATRRMVNLQLEDTSAQAHKKHKESLIAQISQSIQSFFSRDL